MVASAGYVAFKFIAVPVLGALARLVRGPAPAPSARLAPIQPAQTAVAVVDLPQGEDKWKEFPSPPPACPLDFKPIATAVMPCSVHDFYEHILSGHSVFFPDAHVRIGAQWDFTVLRYKAVTADSPVPEVDDNSLLGSVTSVFDFVTGTSVPAAGYTRTLTFINPKKPPASVDAVCVQRQQVAAYEGGHLVFATAMNMLNIPFKDTFTVCTFWQVQPAPEGGCSVTVSLKIKFLKRVFVGGIISATTFRDTAPFYRGFLEAAKIHIEAAPPIRHGPVGLLRQRSMASRTLSRTMTMPAQAGAASRINVALRRFGDGGTSDFWENLPLTSKQIKTTFVLLVLSVILFVQLRMHWALQEHMKDHKFMSHEQLGVLERA